MSKKTYTEGHRGGTEGTEECGLTRLNGGMGEGKKGRMGKRLRDEETERQRDRETKRL